MPARTPSTTAATGKPRAARSKPATKAAAPSISREITIRPLRVNDMTEGAQVYRIRDHGTLSLDPATLSNVKTVGVLRGERWDKDRPRVGDRIEARVTTIYGRQVTASLYTTPEALDAKHPTTRYPEDRARALSKQEDPGVYVEDPEGDRTLPVTPNWGSAATISMIVPDAEPEALRAAIEQVLADQFPGARISKVQTRPAADRRVNVYRPDYTHMTYDKKNGTNDVRYVPVALHVLEAEQGVHISSGDYVEAVHPDAQPPVYGT